MDNLSRIEKNLVVEYVGCFVQQSTRPAEVVRSKLDRRADRMLRLGHSHGMMEAGDPKSCSSGRLSGHWCLSRFGCTEVTWAEENCPERDTVGLELVGRQLIGERRAG